MSIYRNVMLEMGKAKENCGNCHQVTNADELLDTTEGKLCQPCVENPTLK